MFTRYAIFVMLLTFPLQAFSEEFPTGTLEGTGFIVERNGMRITDKDLYAYSSSVQIVRHSEGTYEFTMITHMQRSPSTSQMTDERVDIFEVVWESDNSGRLINKNSSYRNDRTTFTIRDNELVLKSWVARNQLWETHAYSLGN